MNYRTLADMSALIRANLHRIPRVDLIVGIPRSGTIAAAQIAALTNQSLDSSSSNRILLVDDSVSGGQTMRRHKSSLQEWYPRAQITTLAVFTSPAACADICLELVPKPRVFEYNWYRHHLISHSVWDIDGVISTPTVPGEREKGQPLYLPTRKVLALATGRREEEREVTEKQLASWGVQYGKLFMSTDTQRARETKKKAVLETGAAWFVESSIHQAEWLRAQLQIPVLCVDENRMLNA